MVPTISGCCAGCPKHVNDSVGLVISIKFAYGSVSWFSQQLKYFHIGPCKLMFYFEHETVSIFRWQSTIKHHIYHCDLEFRISCLI